MEIFQIPGLTGLPAFLGALVLMGLWVHFSSKINNDKTLKEAEKRAKAANSETIESMQKHIDSLKERMSEAEKENARMQYILDAINAALEEMGMIVTIRGKMVVIKDSKGTSTTIHFNGNSSKKEEE